MKELKKKSVDEEKKAPTEVFEMLSFQYTTRCNNCKKLCSEVDRLKSKISKLEVENESLKKQLEDRPPFSEGNGSETDPPMEQKSNRVKFIPTKPTSHQIDITPKEEKMDSTTLGLSKTISSAANTNS